MCNETMKIEKQVAFKMIWQGAAIVLLATAIGLLVNQIRPGRLTLVPDWSQEVELAPESGECMVIFFDEAQDLFWSGAAVFLDARSSELYQQGHIPGARNLPIKGSNKGVKSPIDPCKSYCLFYQTVFEISGLFPAWFLCALPHC